MHSICHSTSHSKRMARVMANRWHSQTQTQTQTSVVSSLGRCRSGLWLGAVLTFDLHHQSLTPARMMMGATK